MKLRGTHCSLIDGAKNIVEVLIKNKIDYAPGLIKTALKNTNKYLQISETQKGLKLIIRDSVTLQEIKLYKTKISKEELKNLFLKDKKIQKEIKKGFEIFLK
ncbi:hypothetical protein CSB11_02815 [Candidatus Campbellbacteria bacterium]|nr:MAG: hypothetical protein CSB11_02815 [Candidatus Campbellbacteria bacterium]